MSGFIGITFIYSANANEDKSFQSIKCDNTNLNINSIEFNQLTEQEQQDILNQIQRITGEAENEGFANNLQQQQQQQQQEKVLSNPTSTAADGSYDYTLKNDKNLLNICVNLNNNQQQAAGEVPVISDLDLAVANSIDGDVSILIGNGDGTFVTPANDFAVGNLPFGIAVDLFDADSNLDLAVTNFDDGNVSILLGNGDGTFGPANDFDVGNGSVRVAVGNFN